MTDEGETTETHGLGHYRLDRGEYERAAHIDQASWHPAGGWWIWFGGFRWAALLPPMEYTPKADDWLEVRWDANWKMRAFSINQKCVVWLDRTPAEFRQ